MLRFRLAALRARFVSTALLVVLAPLSAAGQSPTTRPRDLVLVVRPAEGGQLEFSVSGPGLATVSGARVLRDGRVQPEFQTRVVYDRTTGTANVSVATRGRPAAGEYTVQLSAGKSPAMYSFPFTVRMLGESGASTRGSRRPDAPTEAEPIDAGDIAVSRPGSVRNPTPNRGVTDTRDAAEAPARPTRDGVRPPVRPGRDVAAPTKPGSDSTSKAPAVDSADRRRRGADTPALVREGIAEGVRSGKRPQEAAASVAGFFPRTEAPEGGTLVLEGANMMNLPLVYLGETKLEKVYSDPTMVAVALPSVSSALSGELSLDDPVPGGTNRVVLASGYRVMRREDLRPELELVELSPGNIPHAVNTYKVRFKNVTNETLPSALLTPSGLTLKDPLFDGKVVTVGGAARLLGSEFTVSFRGKSFQPLSSLELRSGSLARGTVRLPDHADKQEYTVTNTAELDEYFQWQRTWGLGATEGKSEMPLGRSVEVGKIQIDGDTAFRIASGPAGTSAKWQSAPLLMNDGWFVKRIEWSVVQTKPEGQAPKAYVRVHTGPGTFDRGADQLLHADNNSVWPASGGANRELMVRFEEFIKLSDGRVFQDVGKDAFEWYLRPIEVALNADITLLNDHDVTLRMVKVVFSGPPGKEWRDAIKALILNKKIDFLISGNETTMRFFQPRD